MYELEISGYFTTGANGDKVDFDSVKVYLPSCNLDNALSYIKYRVGAWYIKQDERYSDYRIDNLTVVYIDTEPKKVEKENPISNKSVKEMNFFEIQMFAIQHNLFLVPLINQVSLREAKEKALREYYEKVLRNPLKDDLLYGNIPDVKVKEDEIIIAEDVKRIDSDKAINISLKKEEGRDFSFEELKKLAKESGIDFHPNIGYDKLYSKIFG
jgi:hypothetical protein